MSLYLDGPVPWLFDPDYPDLPALARDAESRTPDMRCGDLAADAELFEQLLRERHMGVATGRVELPSFELPAARTWGDLGELQEQLREQLCDNHFRFYGAPREPTSYGGPPVERRVVGDVLVVRIARLHGTPDDERALAAWAADADRDFEHDRIVVDLRGCIGGNDAYTYEWAGRRMRGAEGWASDDTWVVGGQGLSLWNRGVWRHALHGTGLPEPLAGELEIVHEEDDIPAGDLQWNGRMVVLADGLTRSSGESSAWLLRHGMGAPLVGEPTIGMIEYGNVIPYVLPTSGLAVSLATKRNDFGIPVERRGFPVDVPLDPATPVEDVARRFDQFL